MQPFLTPEQASVLVGLLQSQSDAIEGVDRQTLITALEKRATSDTPLDDVAREQARKAAQWFKQEGTLPQDWGTAKLLGDSPFPGAPTPGANHQQSEAQPIHQVHGAKVLAAHAATEKIGHGYFIIEMSGITFHFKLIKGKAEVMVLDPKERDQLIQIYDQSHHKDSAYQQGRTEKIPQVGGVLASNFDVNGSVEIERLSKGLKLKIPSRKNYGGDDYAFFQDWELLVYEETDELKNWGYDKKKHVVPTQSHRFERLNAENDEDGNEIVFYRVGDLVALYEEKFGSLRICSTMFARDVLKDSYSPTVVASVFEALGTPHVVRFLHKKKFVRFDELPRERKDELKDHFPPQSRKSFPELEIVQESPPYPGQLPLEVSRLKLPLIPELTWNLGVDHELRLPLSPLPRAKAQPHDVTLFQAGPFVVARSSDVTVVVYPKLASQDYLKGRLTLRQLRDLSLVKPLDLMSPVYSKDLLLPLSEHSDKPRRLLLQKMKKKSTALFESLRRQSAEKLGGISLMTKIADSEHGVLVLRPTDGLRKYLEMDDATEPAQSDRTGEHAKKAKPRFTEISQEWFESLEYPSRGLVYDEEGNKYVIFECRGHFALMTTARVLTQFNISNQVTRQNLARFRKDSSDVLFLFLVRDEALKSQLSDLVRAQGYGVIDKDLVSRNLDHDDADALPVKPDGVNPAYDSVVKIRGMRVEVLSSKVTGIASHTTIWQPVGLEEDSQPAKKVFTQISLEWFLSLGPEDDGVFVDPVTGRKIVVFSDPVGSLIVVSLGSGLKGKQPNFANALFLTIPHPRSALFRAIKKQIGTDNFRIPLLTQKLQETIDESSAYIITKIGRKVKVSGRGVSIKWFRIVTDVGMSEEAVDTLRATGQRALANFDILPTTSRQKPTKKKFSQKLAVNGF